MHGSSSAASSPAPLLPSAGKLLTSCIHARGRERLLPGRGKQDAGVSKGSQLVCIRCCQTAVLLSSRIINPADGERPWRTRTVQLHAWCTQRFLAIFPTHTDLSTTLTDFITSVIQTEHPYRGRVNFTKIFNPVFTIYTPEKGSLVAVVNQRVRCQYIGRPSLQIAFLVLLLKEK